MVAPSGTGTGLRGLAPVSLDDVDRHTDPWTVPRRPAMMAATAADVEGERMARVLVAAWGTRGDAQAATSLAGALHARGHEVRLAAPGFMAAEAERAGVGLTPLGDDPLAWFDAKPSRRHVDTRRILPRLLPVFARQVDQQFSTLLELSDGVDVVVGQGLVYAAPTVAEALGATYHYLSPNPFFFASRHHPPLSAKRATMPAWVNRLSWAQFAWFYNVVFRSRIDRRRAALGLPPIGDAASHVFDVTRAIGAFDPELYPPPPDIAAALPRAPIGSIPVPTHGSALDEDTAAFLGEGPIVVVDFGSMPDHRPEATGATLIDAARSVGARLVLGAGWAGLRPPSGERVASDVLVVTGVPHSLLFPRADVVVHHGGVGTAASAARAGVPQVIVPHAYDQHASALRLQQAGVAPAPVARSRLGSLASTLRDVLDDPALHERARAVGRSVTARDPLGATVAIVESSLPTAAH
jgi:vancomycin aglycone glucosyltransferase